MPPALVEDESWLSRELEKMSDTARKAFLVWIALPERNLREAADLTGSPHQSVREYSVRYGWKRIAAQYDERLSKDLLAGLRAGIARMSTDAVSYAYDVLRDDKQLTKHRLEAAKWLASLGGLGPRSQPAITDDGDTAVEHTMSELYALARSKEPADLATLLDLAASNRG
jgi:hypothetical protein